MIKIIKILFVVTSILLIGFLLFTNIKIYFGPNLEKQKQVNEDVVNQLNFLEDQLKKENLAFEMQSIYPEGYVFTYALYGLTWCELAMNESNNSERYKRALTEARYAYEQIDSEYAKSNFYIGLNPRYGIYYRGWKNYLLAKILSCQTIKNELEIKKFALNCEEIADAFRSNNSPYLESYPNSSWPADAFLAIASLKIHDEIFSKKYDSLIINWIKKVKSKLDPDTHLIPHSTFSMNGKTIEGARGSSSSLILRLLADIDPEFAVQQYKIFQEKFLITRLGLPAIREYPEAENGSGDIDSGPVLFDVSFAGTIVGVGTLKCFGEMETANLLSGTIEAFGFPLTLGNKKKYIFGQLPIADVFIAWSRIASVNKEVIELKGKDKNSFGSKLRFHIYSIICILFILVILFRSRLIKLMIKRQQPNMLNRA